MNEAVARVLELLTYIEQVEKLKTKPAFSVPDDYFVAHQHELKGLPDLQFNVQTEGDDVWLRMPRLQEIKPPGLDQDLAPWVVLPKSPEKLPSLRQEVLHYEGKQVASRELLKDRPDIQPLFDWYVENQWTPWAEAEVPRRKMMARYQTLFSLQQTITAEGAETPLELVWGIGVAVWKKEGYPTAVKYPLLVQSCDITLNESTFELEVRPRNTEARLEIDCYVEMGLAGVLPLEATWKTIATTSTHRVNPFEPSTYEGVLKAAVGHLDPGGGYKAQVNDVTLPAASDKLCVTNTWVLYARRRSGDIFMEDIRRLKKKVEESQGLPDVVCSLVEKGDDEVKVRPEQPLRGLGSSDSPAGAMELYFPMPYNEEQVGIVRKLETNDGVVVQGPPGTGKTHTIANVISHYLAQGKRVLVTAKGESALAVLRDKLPERIRPLSVALLSDERDGMKQFEHSIGTIASTVASLDASAAARAINIAEAKLNQLHAKIAFVDQQVSAYSAKHLSTCDFQGAQMMPEEIAKLVLQLADAHEWFDDDVPAGAVPLADADINSLRRARLAAGEDIAYLACSLPASDAFPAWSELSGLHHDLIAARAIDADVSHGNVLRLVDSRFETFELAQQLTTFLDSRLACKAKLAGAAQPWTERLRKRFADMQSTDPLLKSLLQVCSEILNLEVQRRALVPKAVELGALAESNDDFNTALGRLVSGRSAFGWPFGQAEARKLVADVRVLGLAPASSDKSAWEAVQQTVNWRKRTRQQLARWTALSAEFGLENVGTDLDVGFKKLVAHCVHIDEVRRLVFELDAQLHAKVMGVFGRNVADTMVERGEPYLAMLATSVQAHVDKGRLGYALKRVQDLVGKLDGSSGAIVNDLHTFLVEQLGRANVDESVLQTQWRALLAVLLKLNNLRPALVEIQRVSAVMEAAGAPKWAERVRKQPVTTDTDPHTPASWLEAWKWRQAVMFLDSIDGHHKLRDLFDERRQLTTTLARTYQDLVAEKTWLGVFNNSPESVRQALQAYLVATKAIGKGGVRSVRNRKTAREAMTQAYKAVPCWVLPQWRVSEAIPAEIGLFHLVIIDEASQSDIWALPALLRGQKVLVVGDDKQVSPSAVGILEEKIVDLQTRFLANQPHGAHMAADKSIYDLASVVFAGNSVMLKEHFRCVPAIIEYSNREFYNGDIRALRLPSSHQRLDPPLIDVYVKGGYRKGDTNPAEAQAIVDEIQAILADEQYARRTIGVVTLLGTAQAAHIQELISRHISPADIVARRITAGPPPVFQGSERDIMMVSMVLTEADRAAQNKSDIRQRFNVALSRARDRMYLFRSVTEAKFREDTLNAGVIAHFKQPFRQNIRQMDELRKRCESGFEREMFDELVKRGYRIEPQVRCGGYYIDFVVEGGEGRRLAIECDGDKYHGPEHWSADMARQRVLERAGWTFWRCFASSFVRRREAVLADLVQSLQKHGIEPLGAESVDNTVWVHSKEVDPFGIEQAQAETLQ